MFYEYNQNNSGGSFDTNDDLDVITIIEAENAEQADERAEGVGIYFDGCEAGMDCDCCGDRWCRAYGDGDVAPSTYGKPVSEETKGMFSSCAIIHFLDGRRERVEFKE